jgi:membrane dipeptidase
MSTGARDAESRVRVLHRESLVINALDSSHEDKFTEEYFEALRTGGIDAVNVTVARVEDHFHDAIRSYSRWRRRLVGLGENRVTVVRRAGDIREAHRNNKVAVILGFQNAKPIEDDLGLIEVFQRLDIRIMQLTYQDRNLIGNGVGERTDDGLSRFGVAAVREMNRVGVIVDLSHVGERSALDAVEASHAPVIASHVVAKAVHNHFRGVSDSVLRAVAERQGCIGVAGLSLFLRSDGVQSGSSVVDYVNHMTHMVDVAGIEHVGIGFDIGFKRSDEDARRIGARYPEFAVSPPLHLRYATEINRADKAENLTAELLRRGYNDDDIRRLLGLNWYRVFGQVWGE